MTSYFSERCPVCGRLFSMGAIDVHVATHDVVGRTPVPEAFMRDAIAMPRSVRDLVAVGELRIIDVPETRLAIVELQTLLDDMRVGASPFAERLEHALTRWLDAPDP
jgi:hypothetical protein